VSDIILKVFGPRDVIPYGIGKDNDIQNTYVVTFRIETPIQEAMRDYPTQLDLIVPNRGVASWMRKGTGRVQRFLSPLLNAFGPGYGRERTETPPFPTVDIYHSYIMDTSINETGQDVMMGEAGTNWAYRVPTRGSDIDSGTRDSNGKPLYR